MMKLSVAQKVGVVACIGAGMATAYAGDLEGIQGALQYDKWWVATGLPEPVGDHPLYPAAGSQTGSTTWRCKECHGWDYKGVDGAYGSGSHFTGIGGVWGSTLTPEQMFTIIKVAHGFGGAGLSDEDVWEIVEFLQDYLIDTDTYIDAGGAFIGDADDGRFNYQAENGFFNCAHCHGETTSDIEGVASSNPWEFIHKARFGHPGVQMPSWLLAGRPDQGVADIGAYLESGLPGPAYAGEASCQGCHADFPTAGFFDAYRASGHRWKVSRTAGQVPAPDFWPHSPVPPLPSVGGVQLEWSDVEYVIGNFFWKARFIDRNGYIYTGDATDTTQWNLATQGFVGYHAGEVDKPFDCGRCHTTGYDPAGNQHGLPGLIGTWSEDGVRCEACHGPSADHVAHPGEMLPPGGKDCDDCHYRDTDFRMPWKGGFMRHHQQGEDMWHSPHAGRDCSMCHDPHRSVVYDDSGIHTDCSTCHVGDASNNFYVVQEMESVDCIECHMPNMAKSAVAVTPMEGDVRGHLWQITRAPVFAADNTYADGSNLFWNVNNRGQGFVTLDYACLNCHNQIGESLTMQEASVAAAYVHSATGIPANLAELCYVDLDGDMDTDVLDFAVFAPNFGTEGHDSYTNGDLDGDGDADVFDFAILSANFGCPN